jgi:hypothetical protein
MRSLWLEVGQNLGFLNKEVEVTTKFSLGIGRLNSNSHLVSNPSTAFNSSLKSQRRIWVFSDFFARRIVLGVNIILAGHDSALIIVTNDDQTCYMRAMPIRIIL